MTVGEFWNAAFLAALTRLPEDHARLEAHKATERCIMQWQPQTDRWLYRFARTWKNTQICEMPPTDFGQALAPQHPSDASKPQ